ncbi:MAG: DUF3656 domain-containing protein [Muricomes sp.]
MTDRTKVEILAPAGSYLSFRAAIAAGADAVYAGGPRFGARAFADNFTEEELLEAIDYAHLHGRRLYLTVNTLLKDKELDELHDYIEPFYRRGLDAVIVQDIGVFSYVREYFPDMDIHVSTQMTVTNTEGALFLQEQGAKRIVPSRELSLQEIRHISDYTDLEIECFVHGALCYSYSGQCLLSSLIGGRSGNRGQCAQPCRLPYTVNGKKEYVLSLKDICTLELIPDMVEAGICSFKIEGRMKKPEYVALVTSMYRKYTDLYLRKGRKEFKVLPEDKEMLLDIYNRGGFSEGYYKQHNSRDMLSLNRSNHAGVPVLKVLSQKGREIKGEALTDIHRGDILEISWNQENASEKNNYTFGNEVPKGDITQILAPKGVVCPKGTVLYRIRRQELLERMQGLYETGIVQEAIWGSFWAAPGEPAVLTAGYEDISVTVQTEEKTEEAKSQPMEESRIRKQLMKTGNTEFVFETLDISVEGAIFLPMQRINELRRKALEQLVLEICQKYHRDGDILPQNTFKISAMESSSKLSGKKPYLSVLAETEVQVRAAVKCPDVRRIYLETFLYENSSRESMCKELCAEAAQNGKEIFLAMPHIFRREAIAFFEKRYPSFLEMGFDGFLIRNYESFHFLMRQGFDKKIILDHNLYVFNPSAKEFWNRQGVDSFTAPVELNRTELERLGISQSELIVYGNLPVMLSAQCIINTTEGCTGKPGVLKIRDRYQKEFPVRNCCAFCYNIIYNTAPLFLLDEREEILNLAPAGLRIQFTQENEAQVESILSTYRTVYAEGRQGEIPDMEFTRGHFKRGII